MLVSPIKPCERSLSDDLLQMPAFCDICDKPQFQETYAMTPADENIKNELDPNNLSIEDSPFMGMTPPTGVDPQGEQWVLNFPAQYVSGNDISPEHSEHDAPEHRSERLYLTANHGYQRQQNSAAAGGAPEESSSYSTSQEDTTQHRRQQRRNQAEWTAEEDAVLYRLVFEFNRSNWPGIAKTLHKLIPNSPQRQACQCNQRWSRVVNPVIRKGKWTDAEDELLIAAILSSPPRKWRIIADKIKGRTDIYVRYRLKAIGNDLVNRGLIGPQYLPE